MALRLRGREALRYAGTATAAVPYLREVATDSELRESLRGAGHALSRIADEMAADQRLRDRLFSRVKPSETPQIRVRRRLRRLGRWGLVVSALVAGGAAVAAAMLYPASRRRITQTVGDARRNVTSLADRVRHKTAETEATSPAAEPFSQAA